MRNGIILLLAVWLLAACSEDEKNETPDNDLVGSWRLIEMLMDPGDGSGTFMPVSSQKTITFFHDGTFESNGNLCTISEDTTQAGSFGVYSLADSTLTPDNCTSSPFPIFILPDPPHLILNFPCIEPCREKYIRL